MRIYNEIVFDVDGNVIYEDSYEYSGDVMLCQEEKKHPFDYNKDGIVNWFDIDLAPDDKKMEVMTVVGNESWTTWTPDTITTVDPDEIIPLSSGEIGTGYTLNPLPSLPTISSVGTVAPTGVVNWNAVPGGFQPLPQTSGGNKKLYQISRFHGGINNKASQRDIADLECRQAENITFSSIGRIRLLGDIENTNNTVKQFSGTDPATANHPGYGLFEFTAPVDADGANAGRQSIVLTADGDQVDALNADSGHDEAWIDFSGADNANIQQIYYAAGNGVYVADANFANANISVCNIYVNRKDKHGTAAAGWSYPVDSKPLIPSPTYNSAVVGSMANGTVRCTHTATTTEINSTMTVTCDPTGSAGDGTWGASGSTTYYFYASWLFDGGCETGLTSFATDGNAGDASDGIAFNQETLTFNISLMHLPHASNETELGRNRRIEGGRIYFKESGTSERWLLAEFNLLDGAKGALDSTFQPWTLSTNEHHHTSIVFDDPPEVYSYASLNGYYANEVYTESFDEIAHTTAGPTAISSGTDGLRYKTVVVGQQGIVFIGNVLFQKNHMPDAMMFSMLGKPAVFPKFNRFDSPSSDGSPITALASFKDTILQFKQNAMYVINVSNPAQFYAEKSFRDCGVFNPCQVFTTSFGVIFVNKHGCFIYDGQKVISLTDGKLDWIGLSGVSESESNGSDANVPCIGYDPRSRSIVVLTNIGDDSTARGSWIYDMMTQSWSQGSDTISNADGTRHTNFIITSDGYLTTKRSTSDTILNYNHDKSADTGAQTIQYWTKDFDFGFPSQTKKLFKVYITYKGSPPSTVNYRVDGTTTEYGFTETNWAAAAVNDYEVATLVPDDSAEGEGWTSISLYFQGAAGGSGETFEINDISILYRLRPIK